MRAALLIFGLVVSGCGHNVGDSCKTNVDCKSDGTRFCDTSAPDGYCTVDGCDVETCPDEAVCIRFLTPVLNETCTFDAAHPNSRADCPHADDRCVCDTSENKICVNNLGHCAPEATERRWCQYKCDTNAECRAGYECRTTGTFGAEPVPSLTNPLGSPAKFCAPNAPPPSPAP
jgi:hypothetical protein